MTAPSPPAQAIVVFGVSGDLGRRKILPALYNLAREGLLPERYAVIGYARTEMSNDEFRDYTRRAVQEFSRSPLEDAVWRPFADSLFYLAGPYDVRGGFTPLMERLGQVDQDRGTEGRRLYYCSTPASAFPEVVARLGECGSQAGNRIVIEKPFGWDLRSAEELNRRVSGVFEEPQVFRIDHFLGKEAVQNLLAFRFANTVVERLWNRDVVDHVQITAAESSGIGSRGAFYEETGAVRDMVQNHLLQVLAFVAMEPPRSLQPEAIRDQTLAVLQAVRPFRPEEAIRGQYRAGVVGGQPVPGYREEPGVASDSRVETYVAIRAFVDNWRWAGVPFFLQTGKRLPSKTTEVTVTFKDVPTYLFQDAETSLPPPNLLSVRIQAPEGISFTFQAKPPGLQFAPRTVAMDFAYREWFMGQPEAYERLLHDAMVGDPTLFIRRDAAQRAWEVVTPLLEDQSPPLQYPAGSWCQAADEFIAPRRWLVHQGGAVVQLGDIMTPDVFTLPPEVTVAEAATAMVKGRFGSVLLVRDDQLVGILTERDVLRAAASGSDLAVAPASEWMTRDPVTVRPDMDTEDAAQIMADRGFRHLPIIEDDEVAGVVSLRDVLAARIRPRHLE